MDRNSGHTVVIDVGGTNFRASIVGPKGRLLLKPEITRTPNCQGEPNVGSERLKSLLIERIVETMNHYRKAYSELDLAQIGISFAGLVDSAGRVLDATTIWGRRVEYPFPLKDLLEERLSATCFIANDVISALWAYGHMLKYRRYPLICVVTVSSGIGAKVYSTELQKVLVDDGGFGGEMAHTVYDFSDSAPTCACGGKGHLTSLASGRAAEYLARVLARDSYVTYKRSPYFRSISSGSITASNIADAARGKDMFALEIVDRVTFPLAHAISNLAVILGVRKFIIIGGFALGVGPVYLESLRSNLKRIGIYGLPKQEIGRIVTLGRIDDYPELVGIGLLARQKVLPTLGSTSAVSEVGHID